MTIREHAATARAWALYWVIVSCSYLWWWFAGTTRGHDPQQSYITQEVWDIDLVAILRGLGFYLVTATVLMLTSDVPVYLTVSRVLESLCYLCAITILLHHLLAGLRHEVVRNGWASQTLIELIGGHSETE